MDPLHHHHHHHAPLHWGYSGSAVAHPHHGQHHQHTWVPPPTTTTTSSGSTTHGSNAALSSRKLKRAMSESDCEDLYSEESSKDQTSPGESDSCHMMSRKKRRGVIEKKRRDRINLSLCELKRLVPSAYEKQGSAKLEKAEILQLTVDHLKTIQGKGGADGAPFDAQRFAVDYHIVGFRECASEVARYLVTMEGMDIQDPLRLRLMSHLQCFMAQRELQLKSNNSASDLLSPAAGLPTASSTPSIVNPVSPNMDHASSTANWSSSTASYHHQQGAYQMMPAATSYPNAYASQTAVSSGGYVPNLPPPLGGQQYDQYGNQRSSTEAANNNSSYSSETSASTRSGVTTRSQSNSTATADDVNNGGSSSTDQTGPTYTDLSSSSATGTAAVATSGAASTTAVSASVVGINNNNRVQNNYNIYGHIHYPADATATAFGGHHHHGYNVHLDPSRGGYNGGGQGNGGGAAAGNAKPYRPWGAEMAY